MFFLKLLPAGLRANIKSNKSEPTSLEKIESNKKKEDEEEKKDEDDKEEEKDEDKNHEEEEEWETESTFPHHHERRHHNSTTDKESLLIKINKDPEEEIKTLIPNDKRTNTKSLSIDQYRHYLINECLIAAEKSAIKSPHGCLGINNQKQFISTSNDQGLLNNEGQIIRCRLMIRGKKTSWEKSLAS